MLIVLIAMNGNMYSRGKVSLPWHLQSYTFVHCMHNIWFIYTVMFSLGGPTGYSWKNMP